jgi:hypothetical protein
MKGGCGASRNSSTWPLDHRYIPRGRIPRGGRQNCSIYLQTVARTGIRARSTLDTLLTLAAWERWYTRW